MTSEAKARTVSFLGVAAAAAFCAFCERARHTGKRGYQPIAAEPKRRKSWGIKVLTALADMAMILVAVLKMPCVCCAHTKHLVSCARPRQTAGINYHGQRSG